MDGHGEIRVPTDAEEDLAIGDMRGRKASDGIMVTDLYDGATDDVEHQRGGHAEEFRVGEPLGVGAEELGQAVGEPCKCTEQEWQMVEAADGQGLTGAVDHGIEFIGRAEIELDGTALGTGGEGSAAILDGQRGLSNILDVEADLDVRILDDGGRGGIEFKQVRNGSEYGKQV